MILTWSPHNKRNSIQDNKFKAKWETLSLSSCGQLMLVTKKNIWNIKLKFQPNISFTTEAIRKYPSPCSLCSVKSRFQWVTCSMAACITSSSKRPQEIQSCHWLAIGSNHPGRVWNSSFLIKCITIHIVTSVTWKLHSILFLKRIRSWLCKLTCHSTYLNNQIPML